MTTQTMSPKQFEVLARLIRSRSNARESARLVLVEGKRKRDAAIAAGTSRQTCNDAVRRFKEADHLVRLVYGPPIAPIDARPPIAPIERSSGKGSVGLVERSSKGRLKPAANRLRVAAGSVPADSTRVS